MTRTYQTWHGFTICTDTEMPARMVKIMDANDPDNWETTRILYNVGPSYCDPQEAKRLLGEAGQERARDERRAMQG